MPQAQITFSRYRDIAVDVAARLADGGEAIVASSGVAAAIIAAALRNAPTGAVRLQLPTIEAFARAIVNDAGEYPRIATDLEQRFAMRAAAKSVADAIVDSPALGSMLSRSYRDVRDAGLTLDQFEARTRSQRSLRNTRRTAAMLRAWREYEWLIAQVGAVDPADVLLRAAAIVEQGCEIDPRIVAGFYDMTGAQLRIVHALARRGKLSEVFIPAGADDPFVARFVSALPGGAPAIVAATGNPPRSQIAQYENKATELAETCRSIASLIHDGVAASAIAVVARSISPHDIHLLHRFAADYGFSITSGESIPLAAHRIGRALLTLLHLRERSFPRAEVFGLLRDGWRTERHIAIDALDDATRRANIACGDSDAVRSRAADYADILAEIEPLAPSGPLSGSGWSALLTRAAERFRVETEEDAAAIEALDQIAAILRRAELWRRRFDSASIADLLEQIRIAPPAESASLPQVWSGDVMRFRGRTFEHVFAIRVEDEVFPQRRTDDPLLPDADRRLVGLREIGDGRDEERLLFRLLQSGAEAAIELSVAASDGIGKLIRPSSFLKNFAIEKFPERRANILRDFGREFARAAAADRRPATASRQLQLVVNAGTQSGFDGYLVLDAAIEARIRAAVASIAPTHLEDFGECPQKFLLKHILGVRDLDEPERELHVNARDKGSLDHRILERFYRTVPHAEITAAIAELPRLAAPLRERLHGIIEAAFDELETKMPPFNRAMRDIERRATRRHLQEFVAADIADLAAAELRPRHFEYAFGTRFAREGTANHPDPFVLSLGDVSMSVDGRIDRIDRSEDDATVRVVDYKSGKALRHRDLADKIDRGVRMQLALYAMAVADFFGADPQKVSGAIKPLRGGDGAKYSFGLAAHSDGLRETISLFVHAMLRGAFPAYPSDNDNDFNACKYCPVNHSCRTKHDDAEKYAVTRHGDPRTLLHG